MVVEEVHLDKEEVHHHHLLALANLELHRVKFQRRKVPQAHEKFKLVISSQYCCSRQGVLIHLILSPVKTTKTKYLKL